MSSAARQVQQPLPPATAEQLALPRYERWKLSQAEVAKIPPSLSLTERRQAQTAIWDRWGL